MSEYINKKPSAALVGVAAAALAGGYFLRGANVTAQDNAPQAPVVQTAATKDASVVQNAFTQVSEAVEPAVVTITTLGSEPKNTSGTVPRINPFGGPDDNNNGNGDDDPFKEFFKRFQHDFGMTPNSLQRQQIKRQYFRQIQERGGGLGSGMIFKTDANRSLILTNAHVVAGADTVSVKLVDDREIKKAKVLGVDERTDIAVVQINVGNLPTVKLGESSDVKVGDWAIAVGNPFGLDHTLTVGVISAKAREVPLNERNPGDYLQTDASINPGNSGGPLCDIEGRVIGVNNAIYSQSGGNVGIGFAIPIDTARNIAEQLMTKGKIVRGYLGVRIQDITADNAAAYGLPDSTKGVLVAEVDKDTPGARAGLQEGDVIVGFNGQTVIHSTELQRLVGSAPVGSMVKLKVLRDGQTTELTARLDEFKGDSSKPTVTPTGNLEEAPSTSTGPLGLALTQLTPANAKQFGIDGAKGALVAKVADGSPADTAGLKRGDLIERVGQKLVSTPLEATAAIKSILDPQKDDTKSVALLINRKGERSYVVLDIDNSKP